MRFKFGLFVFTAFVLAGLEGRTQEFPIEYVQAWDLAFKMETVTDQLELPWGMVFLSEDEAVITERRPSAISLVNLKTGQIKRLKGIPKTFTEADAGMKDIALHPDFATNGWIYFSYSAGNSEGSTLVVERAKIKGDSLVEWEEIFRARPLATWEDHHFHFGARLVFKDGYLFVSVGDRHNQDLAQDLSTHNGSILRLFPDGSVPPDNPFVGTPGAQPEIWAYGVRNPQGLGFHPETGILWETEHGPFGADEINIIEKGKNYGWPVITHGLEYDGNPIGEGISEKEGMEQPVMYYSPTLAPSGLLFYTGDQFPKWRMSMFIGSMMQGHLRRIKVYQDRVINEEILLADKGWRVRFIKQSPEGLIYIGTDGGFLLRLTPAE